jgi:uncharacterized membrane protein
VSLGRDEAGLSLKKGAPSPEIVEDPPPIANEPGLEWVGGGGTDLGRIIGLSDGVFSFAMTFLVISLALPTLVAGGQKMDLYDYLLSIRSGLLDYALAFLVVASWWSIHHQLFSALRRYDLTLMRLNNFFLLCVSITPFTLALVFQYGPNGFLDTSWTSKEAVIIFSAVQVLTGVLLFSIWQHATGERRLVDPALPDIWIRETERASQLRIVWFLAAIGVALVLPQISEFMWLGPMINRHRRVKKVVAAARERAAKAPPLA